MYCILKVITAVIVTVTISANCVIHRYKNASFPLCILYVKCLSIEYKKGEILQTRVVLGLSG